MTDLDLGLNDISVYGVEIRSDQLVLQFDTNMAYLELGGLIDVTLPGGRELVYSAELWGRDPHLPELMDALAGATVAASRAERETGILDLEFGNGLRLHYEPSDGPYEEWQAENPAKDLFVCLTNNSVAVWRGIPQGN